jgi:superfamily II DNA or RNA helicase
MTLEQAMAKRAEVQTAATNAALEAFNRDVKRVGLVIGTGVGKTKIALDILNGLNQRNPSQNLPIIIAVSATDLRDSTWYAEMHKFNRVFPNVILECYQTLYKWENTKAYAVIADEGDFALTQEYSKFFKNNDLGYLLFMTAFVTEAKQEMLREVVDKVVYEYSTQDAQKDGILNPTKFYEVRFPVGHTPTRRVEYKKGGKAMSFIQSENAAYEFLEKKYLSSLFAYRASRAKANSLTLLGNDIEGLAEITREMDKHFAKMKIYAGKRKTLLHTLESSRKVAKELIAQIHSKPGNKVLLFAMLTEQADGICEHTYHGKSTTADAINKLNSGEIRTLGVAKKVNRGINLEGVNVLIKESYVGSDTDFQQQHGRGVRLRPDQTMYFIVMVPYYYTRAMVDSKIEPGKKVEAWVMVPTQADEWADNMTTAFDFEPEVIVMNHDPKQDKYTLPLKYYDNFCHSS